MLNLEIPSIEEKPPYLPKIRPCYLAMERLPAYKANAKKSQGIRIYRMKAIVAQSVEHLPCKQEVVGSNPTCSTIKVLADQGQTHQQQVCTFF